MIFGGNFQQILSVIPNGSCADIVDACLRMLYLWNDIIILKLQMNMQLQNSPENITFSQWLLDIGHGRHTDNDRKIRIPQLMVTFDEDDLINTIYKGIENIKLTPPPLHYFLDHAILAPHNINV